MHQPALDIMQQMQTSLKLGILQNSIGEFAQPPAFYAFFRSSTEGIPHTSRNKCTSNSQTTSQRSNAPRSKNTRNTQRTNIPTVNVDEIDWIVKNNRSRNVSLPWLTGGVKLCTAYCIIVHVCKYVGDNCPNIIHSTYEELSRPNQNTVSRWIDFSHSLSWPGLCQGNQTIHCPLTPFVMRASAHL